MTRPIGYYVHHHGDGHRQRALAIAAAAPGRFTLIGTGLQGRTGSVSCLDLPDDRPTGASGFDGRDDAEDRPQALHYAPLDHDGVRARVAALMAWIKTARPALMVVDVSVEIAMLARLAATPTVYVRLAGRRDDPAHGDAFRGARALLAPFHRDLDDPETAEWIRGKTLYAPGLAARAAETSPKRRDRVLFVQGRGGGEGSGERLAEAARATPALDWRAIGKVAPARSVPPNLTLVGWTDAPAAEIAAAGVVVGAAGDGLVNAVLAAGKPFICLPEPRPFGEQEAKAARLQALGAAIVAKDWPEPAAWPALIAQAMALDPGAQRRLHCPDGARRTAEALITLARKGSVDASP